MEPELMNNFSIKLLFKTMKYWIFLNQILENNLFDKTW